MSCKPVILAAGLGTRMRSDLPKVLHTICNRPMIAWAMDTARAATGEVPTVVLGPEHELITSQVEGELEYVVQQERLGTGHALLQAKGTLFGKSDYLLVTSADMPLLKAATLQELVKTGVSHGGPVTLLSVIHDRSRGFGRILRRDDRSVMGIVEEAVASEEQLAIREFNAGAYCFRADWLWEHLEEIEKSETGEYYLTDIVGLAADLGERIAVVQTEDPEEVIGVNTRAHLAEAEAAMRWRINLGWMEEGVSLQDPRATYIDPGVLIGKDTLIMANTHLLGDTTIGPRCEIGPNSIIRNSRLGADCRILASVLEGATLEAEVDVGPFARLRSGAVLSRGVHVGNFGEIKNSTLGEGVKVGHFSYLGDATIGDHVNIGAGTITCNYDGKRKHPTTIGEGAFIGSDTMLVAPVTIGRGAKTGAGAVVTRDVPEDTLAAGVPARAIRKLNVDD